MFTLISDVIADNLFLFRVLGSILIFVLFWALKGTITKTVVKLLTKLLNRSRQIADQSTLRFVLGPLKHFLAVSGLYLALMNLHPGAGWSDFFLKVYRIAVIILISIVLLRLCDCASDNLFQPFGKQEELENRLNKTLMTLLKKAAKVLILIIAGIAVLSETGINVAHPHHRHRAWRFDPIALAAQDTAQNLFGGLVILLDKPFQVDDWISTPDIEGVVEDITFRSTRVRTFPNALVVVPNSTLVSSPITNWSRMNKRRASFTVGLTYDTTEAQLQRCIARITEMINQNPEVLADDTVVAFNSFQDSSLEISVLFYTRATSFSAFQKIKEQVNYGIMKIVEEEDASFAFPTQTVYLQREEQK